MAPAAYLAHVLYTLWVCLTKALVQQFYPPSAPRPPVPLFKTRLGFIGSKSGQDPKEECYSGVSSALATQHLPMACGREELCRDQGHRHLLTLLQGHGMTMPQKKPVLVPQKWVNKSLLALHMEENPTGFGRNVSLCHRRRCWDPAVGTGTGQWVTGECIEEPPVPPHPFQWGLGAARPAGLGSPTNPPRPRATFPSLCGLWLGIGGPSSSQTTIATSAGSSGHGGCAGNNPGGAMPPPLPRPQHAIKTPRELGLCSAQHRKAP